MSAAFGTKRASQSVPGGTINVVTSATPKHTLSEPRLGPQLRRMLLEARDVERSRLPKVVSEHPRILLVEEDALWPEHVRSISTDVDLFALRFALPHLVPSNRNRVFRIPSSGHVHSFSESPCYCPARHGVGGPGQGRVRSHPLPARSSKAKAEQTSSSTSKSKRSDAPHEIRRRAQKDVRVRRSEDAIAKEVVAIVVADADFAKAERQTEERGPGKNAAAGATTSVANADESPATKHVA